MAAPLAPFLEMAGEFRHAVRIVRPYAVDTAGGVESEPGKKDHERVKEFIRNAKVSLS